MSSRRYRLWDVISHLEPEGLTPGIWREMVKYRIVPPACGRGRTAYYTDDHIQMARKALDIHFTRPTWESIRDILYPLSEDDEDE